MLAPGDALAVWGLAQQIDPNPLGLVGRVVGLGEGERQAIPTWVWYASAGVLGVGLLVWSVRSVAAPRRGRIFATR
jgi:hypothetical protein